MSLTADTITAQSMDPSAYCCFTFPTVGFRVCRRYCSRVLASRYP
jgi:hypothetical protein